jgi:transcriptional regulator with XRE-family HTH domain
MSLRDVADAAGCSPSFISQIEREAVSPTIKSLDRICRALDVTLADFVREETAVTAPIVCRADEPAEGHIAIHWPAARLLHLLPPGKKYPFTALILQIDTDGSVPKRRAFFPLQELCVVLRGSVSLDLGTEVYALNSNDSIFFDLSISHHWSNTGESVAEILLTSPNSFHLFEDVESNVRWHAVWKRQKRLQRERLEVITNPTKKKIWPAPE